MQTMRKSFHRGLNYIADRAMELSHDLYKVSQIDRIRLVIRSQVEVELTCPFFRHVNH